jgi:hypothetical protein
MAEPSTEQMQLVASDAFLTRVQYLAWDEAARVVDEDQATPEHEARVNLAHTFLTYPAQTAPTIALAICRSNAPGRVILGTVVPSEDPMLVDSSAPDLALSSAITFYWNSIAQVATGGEA